MEAQELIEKISKAKKIQDILSPSNLRGEYTSIMMKLHPDKCSLVGASDAAAKLNDLKDFYVLGKSIQDDIGTYKTNYEWVMFNSDNKHLEYSYENWEMLRMMGTEHFNKYLPINGIFHDEEFLTFELSGRSVPINGLRLDEEHARWVLSRLLEFSSYLAGLRVIHAGLIPESVFITPETHGIQVVSYYHMVKKDSKMKTISAGYKDWYPHNVFSKKVGDYNIDIELSKRLCIYVLGANSATALKGKASAPLVEFLLKGHSDPLEAYSQYRIMLKDNFESKFHILNI